MVDSGSEPESGMASLLRYNRKTVERSIKKVRGNHNGVTHA